MADITQSLKGALDARRDGYDKELTWHKFLLDSYTGGGGFEGRVKQDAAGFWGAVAATYSRFSVFGMSGGDLETTYLDRFDREDGLKYARRQSIVHYLNYVEPTTAIKVGYLIRKPNKRLNAPKAVEEWAERTGFDRERRRRALLTAVLGWWPMLVDLPSAPTDALTMQETGKLDPYCVLNLPCHLYDYQLDDKGEFKWAKLVVVNTTKDSWSAEARTVTRYVMWTPEDFTIYEADGEHVRALGTSAHPFRQVPIVSWRADTSIEGDNVKAASINAAIAPLCRRLFNLCSEMDEHIRCQVFAQLIWPGPAPGANDSKEGGVSTGLTMDETAKHVPFYLAPPESVAATLETRMAALIVEIYRIAGVEYERASGVQSSAQSKENEFAKTNVAIVSLAQALARAERQTLILVGRALKCDEAELQKIEVVAAESFADAALGDEMAQVMDALTLKLGRRAQIEMKTRLVHKLLPGLSSDTLKEINSEIEEEVDQAIKDAEALAVQQLAAGEDADSVTGDPTGKSDHPDGPAKPADESQGLEAA